MSRAQSYRELTWTFYWSYQRQSLAIRTDERIIQHDPTIEGDVMSAQMKQATNALREAIESRDPDVLHRTLAGASVREAGLGKGAGGIRLRVLVKGV